MVAVLKLRAAPACAAALPDDYRPCWTATRARLRTFALLWIWCPQPSIRSTPKTDGNRLFAGAIVVQKRSRIPWIWSGRAGLKVSDALFRFPGVSGDVIQGTGAAGTGTWVVSHNRRHCRRPGCGEFDGLFGELPWVGAATVTESTWPFATRSPVVVRIGDRVSRVLAEVSGLIRPRRLVASGTSIDGSLVYGDLPAPDGAETTDIAEALSELGWRPQHPKSPHSRVGVEHADVDTGNRRSVHWRHPAVGSC